MKHDIAPGLDGFPSEFYEVFWNVIEEDLMALFVDFHKGYLPLQFWNNNSDTKVQ
jgi:hypothetical protein